MNPVLCPNCSHPTDLIGIRNGLRIFQCGQCGCVITKASGHGESRLGEMHQVATEIIEERTRSQDKGNPDGKS
jgi:ribosomal protein L37AE/L43A